MSTGHHPTQPGKSINRRAFLAGASAISFQVMSSRAVKSYAANAKIKLGLIGCGGRGVWISRL
ncbi:MAG TPA: hypothetical protein PK878_12020, partial [bacterium]|nr:hypothetical protein [bacterium]